jgi:hypothetical protein
MERTTASWAARQGHLVRLVNLGRAWTAATGMAFLPSRPLASLFGYLLTLASPERGRLPGRRLLGLLQLVAKLLILGTEAIDLRTKFVVLRAEALDFYTKLPCLLPQLADDVGGLIVHDLWAFSVPLPP